MSFSPDRLSLALEEALPPRASGIAVAVSGGPDSAALLAALRLTPARTVRALPVRALHVDHGLQSAAAAMRAASAAICARFEVPLTILELHMPASGGLSVEALARDLRYDRLRAELREQECLLTAHHQQDQAETVLLQLLRGAGPKGLAGMPVRRRLGRGWHVRPLLEVTRDELLAFGCDASLATFADPMNSDPRFERAYLRATLWPLIERRWPGAAKALARSAAHLAAAERVIDGEGARIVSRVRDGEALCLKRLRALGELEQLNAVRCFIAAAGVRLPSSARLREALRQMLEARADHIPTVAWQGGALRRYRDRLYLGPEHPPRLTVPLNWPVLAPPSRAPMAALEPVAPLEVAPLEPAAPLEPVVPLEPAAPLELPPGLGRLRLVRAAGGLDPARIGACLEVRGRDGSERLRVARGGHTRNVRELCQSWGIVPWMRDALPFVHAGGTLIAVGDLWLNADWRAAPGAPGVIFCWEDAPALQ